MMELVLLYEETPESFLSLSVYHVRTQQKGAHLQDRRKVLSGTLDLGFLIFQKM